MHSMIQEIVFRLCTKQSAGRKSQGKQLKFTPQLDKFVLWKLALRNIMFWKRKSVYTSSKLSKPQSILNRSSFKCLFLDIGSESLQFDNASIYIRFGVKYANYAMLLTL